MKLKNPFKVKSLYLEPAGNTPEGDFAVRKLSTTHMLIFMTIFALIGGYLLFRTFAAAPIVASVEAESMNRPASAMVISDSSASLGQAVQLRSDGTISSKLNLAAPASSLNIKIKGISCDRNWPKIRIKVDGQIVSTTSIVNSASWRDKVIPVNLVAGSHDLSIDGLNLGGTSNCTRTLFVDNAVFYGSVTTSPPPLAPSITIGANPSSIYSGSSSTITWASANATSCLASGAWSGTRAISGTTSTGALSSNSTYTLTCTGTGGSAVASTTVTVNSTPTPPPPTPTPPPASGTVTCLVSNRTNWDLAGTNCKIGTTITLTNTAWTCDKALSSYGALPIKVVINATSRWGTAADGAVDLVNGCVGDNNSDTIDLILDIKGEGQRSDPNGDGWGGDSAKVRAGTPHDIQLTGRFDCGRIEPGAHQDVWQFQQTGYNIAIVNGVSGNWETGTSTCQGAGGAIFWSTGGNNIDILGGRYVTCNAGLRATQSSPTAGNDVIGAGFRTGRPGSSDPNCVGFAGTAPCAGVAGLSTFSGVTCQRWNTSTNGWADSSPTQ